MRDPIFMIEIIPAILEKDFSGVAKKIQRVDAEAQSISWVQLDIMDGVFVPNTTWNFAQDLLTIQTRLFFEVHLMVANPQDEIRAWLTIPNVGRIIFHSEAIAGAQRVNTIVKIKEQRKEVGIALNPSTSLEEVRDHITILDEVLVMTVSPGFSGQPFKEGVLNKMRALKEMYPNMVVGVDGGINMETAERVIAAGATRLSVNSYLWKSADIEEAIRTLLPQK